MSAADIGTQAEDGVHVMIDIETMSTAPNAAILAIGAVTFTVDNGVDATSAREWLVDLGDSVAHGGQMDADTVLWWTQQSERARRGLVATRQLREQAALEGLAWMLSCLPGKPSIWQTAATSTWLSCAAACAATPCATCGPTGSSATCAPCAS